MGNRTRQRILSLDGGGTWCIIQVEALAKLYPPETRGHDILRDFDHAVANSGGSVVLAALLLNARLSELRENFCDLGTRQTLFRPIGAWDGGLVFHFFRMLTGGPRYSTRKKREGLAALLNGYARANDIHAQTLAELAASIAPDFHFIMIGYDYRRDRAKYFRSRARSRAASRDVAALTPDLIDAVHASTTAPVQYFDRFAEGASASVNGELFWDGAITGQNNPVVSGIIEALANGAQREDIAVLSIGTGGNALPPELVHNPAWQIESHLLRGVADLKKVSKSIIGDPPDHASFVAHMLLTTDLPDEGGRCNASPIVRLNPIIGPMPRDGTTPWVWPQGLATPEQRKVADLDMAAVGEADFGRVHQLTKDWIEGRVRNQPVRMGSDLSCDLGDETFGEAVARWREMR